MLFIRESGIDRSEIFVTAKAWNVQQGFETTLNAFHESLNALELGYIDLYLIRWPFDGDFVGTWRALEELWDEGSVRAIGVSNFMVRHLQDLVLEVRIPPMVNQIEMHPRLHARVLSRE